MRNKEEIQKRLAEVTTQRDALRESNCPCGCEADTLDMLESQAAILKWVLEDPKPDNKDLYSGGMP